MKSWFLIPTQNFLQKINGCFKWWPQNIASVHNFCVLNNDLSNISLNLWEPSIQRFKTIKTLMLFSNKAFKRVKIYWGYKNSDKTILHLLFITGVSMLWTEDWRRSPELTIEPCDKLSFALCIQVGSALSFQRTFLWKRIFLFWSAVPSIYVFLQGVMNRRKKNIDLILATSVYS